MAKTLHKKNNFAVKQCKIFFKTDIYVDAADNLNSQTPNIYSKRGKILLTYRLQK